MASHPTAVLTTYPPLLGIRKSAYSRIYRGTVSHDIGASQTRIHESGPQGIKCSSTASLGSRRAHSKSHFAGLSLSYPPLLYGTHNEVPHTTTRVDSQGSPRANIPRMHSRSRTKRRLRSHHQRQRMLQQVSMECADSDLH